MLIVKDLKKLRALPPTDEQVIVEETRTMYKWNGSDWEIQKDNGITVSEYEIACRTASKMPAINESSLVKAVDLVKEYATNANDDYFMLLNNELHYYTILHVNHSLAQYPRLTDKLVELLEGIGDIKGIDYTENKMGIECWVTNPNGESHAYLLFAYGKGVCEVV